MKVKKNIFWGIFFVALTTLTWEVLITRIFSATMYYHFVFMSISLAMLGFGCSGVLVFLFPKTFSLRRCDRQMAGFSWFFALTILLAIVVYLQVSLAIDMSLRSFVQLFIIFIFIFIPYLFSGLTITLALKHYARSITRLYCYDLIGAGVGSVCVIGLLYVYDGISLVLLTACTACVAAIFFSSSAGSKWFSTTSFALLAIMLTLFLVNAYGYRFLKVSYVQGISQDDIVFEKWNPINRVTVTPEAFQGNKTLRINYDAAALAHMHRFDGSFESVDYLRNIIQSFYYGIRKNAKVLIIGVGGGQDVLNAYTHGQKDITGIEINPTIAKLNTDIYRDFNGGLFHRPGVQLIVDEGRNFVRHTHDRYDIIHLPNVDSGVASSSGAFTFVENTLYTVEAFSDYYHTLTDNGVLWLARWRTGSKAYYLENFRVFTGILRTLEQMGVPAPGRHIVMIEEPEKNVWRQAIMLMKKQPFNDVELAEIDRHREKLGLQWLFHPHRRLDNTLNDYLHAPDRTAFLETYPLNVKPNTDNQPFFFNFLKPKHYFGKLPPIQTHFTYPVFMFKSLFVVVFTMVLLTIFLPMVLFQRGIQISGTICFRGGYVVYFICLGLGFMLVEIPLIQKFILFLGQPLYAIAVILSCLLIFSGVGSLLAGRIPLETVAGRLRLIIALLCVFLTVSIFTFPAIFNLFLGSPAAVRFLISVLLVLPLGLVMGMALPLGIRLIEQDAAPIIPWVWAVNGACSVMGSVVAWGLSLNFGYNATIWMATAVYAIAGLVMFLRPSDRMKAA